MPQRAQTLGSDDLERDVLQRIQKRMEANDPFSDAAMAARAAQRQQEAAAATQPDKPTTAPPKPAAEPSGRSAFLDVPLQVAGGARDAITEMTRFVD